MTVDGFDFSKHVFRGQKRRVLGGWDVGGWSRGGPLKSSSMGSVKDLSAPHPLAFLSIHAGSTCLNQVLVA